MQDGAIDQARRLGYKLAATEWNLNGWWHIKERGELWPGLRGCGLGAAVMLQSIVRAGDVIALGNHRRAAAAGGSSLNLGERSAFTSGDRQVFLEK